MGTEQHIKETGEIIILDELRNFISPLSTEEFHYLEQSLLKNGCKDPLTLWQSEDGFILIDGHHRLQICQKHNIEFTTEVLQFTTMEEVQIWMVNHQIGRRNLTADQLSYYRGKKYLLLKKSHGGHTNVENKGNRGATTSKLLSEEFKVGESTIKRDAKFAEGLGIISQSNPELKNKILKGETGFKKGDIQLISDFDDKQKSLLKVKNEADLFNKISRFRKENVDEIERKLDEIENTKHADAQAELRSRDSMFSNQEERLERIKARIISAINDAIRNKNLKAIEELKGLVDRLQKELVYME
ncbi:MAG: ParB N-terminal domain-containing protein [Cyclobacteriaceae bacterium]|tara:strand:+ start:1205 stop:2107 length:903 start_codon:yes stop_codon:yes gene_type:complete